MAGFTALYDACVLYPAPLRDLLLQLATSDLFRAKWSNAIHEEWIRSVLAKRPDLNLQQLHRTRPRDFEKAKHSPREWFTEVVIRASWDEPAETMGEALDHLEEEFGRGKTSLTAEDLETSRKLCSAEKRS